ncbi:hypothetical protein LshimejAT787_1105430 [Lyophyllum shimeji]|uniref:Uncharacterized protein n=1 Tax=Lyophyllum shimeji TaxID=47721 RepID=A0A9P3PVU8_LYOSH|nr:hypothetical protein LshimejAT787_1105430 [Lyophyllum shimeji]
MLYLLNRLCYHRVRLVGKGCRNTQSDFPSSVPLKQVIWGPERPVASGEKLTNHVPPLPATSAFPVSSDEQGHESAQVDQLDE